MFEHALELTLSVLSFMEVSLRISLHLFPFSSKLHGYALVNMSPHNALGVELHIAVSLPIYLNLFRCMLNNTLLCVFVHTFVLSFIQTHMYIFTLTHLHYFVPDLGHHALTMKFMWCDKNDASFKRISKNVKLVMHPKQKRITLNYDKTTSLKVQRTGFRTKLTGPTVSPNCIRTSKVCVHARRDSHVLNIDSKLEFCFCVGVQAILRSAKFPYFALLIKGNTQRMAGLGAVQTWICINNTTQKLFASVKYSSRTFTSFGCLTIFFVFLISVFCVEKLLNITSLNLCHSLRLSRYEFFLKLLNITSFNLSDSLEYFCPCCYFPYVPVLLNNYFTSFLSTNELFSTLSLLHIRNYFTRA